ncbi:MAG: hypothetical protein RLZZ387_1617 [Chloroflexota bacterium]|jgi:hypothetical protein
MTAPGHLADALLHRMLALPAVERALNGALARPRVLQTTAAGLCALLATISLAGGLGDSGRGATVPGSWPQAGEAATSTPSALAEQRGSPADQAIEAVAAYNRASIAAAALGDGGLLLPHLDPDGPARASAEAEYARRAPAGETRNATLRRWGVLRAEADGDVATVETQELWDLAVRERGRLVDSRRGVLTRNVYALRLRSERWLITDVISDTLLQ